MAEKDYDSIRIYGDLDSELWLAPLGSTLPETLAEPTAPFDPFGWLSDDGVELTVETNVEKFRGWQGGTVLRTKVTSTDRAIAATALQETPLVTSLFFGHGPVTVTGLAEAAVARYDIPESIGTVARAGVASFIDGGVKKFLVCERLEVTNRGAVPHNNNSPTQYEFGLEIIGAAYVLTNAPAYLAA